MTDAPVAYLVLMPNHKGGFRGALVMSNLPPSVSESRRQPFGTVEIAITDPDQLSLGLDDLVAKHAPAPKAVVPVAVPSEADPIDAFVREVLEHVGPAYARRRAADNPWV